MVEPPTHLEKKCEIVKLDHLPKFFGVKLKKIFELPPPSCTLSTPYPPDSRWNLGIDKLLGIFVSHFGSCVKQPNPNEEKAAFGEPGSLTRKWWETYKIEIYMSLPTPSTLKTFQCHFSSISLQDALGTWLENHPRTRILYMKKTHFNTSNPKLLNTCTKPKMTKISPLKNAKTWE